jgi:hypothetical protein
MEEYYLERRKHGHSGTTCRVLNNKSAPHVVTVSGVGYNVRFPHGDYWISLAADGSETVVEGPSGDIVFRVEGTNVESLQEALEYFH